MNSSSSRVHQILGSDEAPARSPAGSASSGGGTAPTPRQETAPSQDYADLQVRLAGELEALRQCREWLERLDRGELVVMNLRPETDPDTEYVAFDRPTCFGG